MSEREFLKLLNLYLDREISAEDADRLEREVRTDPSRNRTYLQYCRMQQGVRRLGTAEAIRAGEGSPVGRAPARSPVRELWAPSWAWTGAIAAAAVLVLIFVARRPESTSATAEDRLAADAVPRNPHAAGRPSELALSGDALLLSTFPSSGSTPKVHEDQFNWMRQFQLVSLESRIGAQPLPPSPGAPPPVAPLAAPRAAGDDATEMSAFKFVK